MSNDRSDRTPAPADGARAPAPQSTRSEIDGVLSKVKGLAPAISSGKRETQTKKVQALVFVGDAMEEKLDDLCHGAGELGLLGVPAFMFQEGNDPITEQAFREIARLSHGAYCRFDVGAAHQLAELLRAVAAYAAGGVKALADLSARRGAASLKLLEQLK